MGIAAALLPARPAPARTQSGRVVSLSASCADPGESVTVTGRGFLAKAFFNVLLGSSVVVANGLTTDDGSFSVSIAAAAGQAPGQYTVWAGDAGDRASAGLRVPCSVPPPTSPPPTPAPSPPTTASPPTTRPRPTTTQRATTTTPPTPPPRPSVGINPASGPAGASVVVTGSGVQAPCEVAMAGVVVVPAEACAPQGGAFASSVTVPAEATGTVAVILTGRDATGAPVQAETTYTVVGACELPADAAILGADPASGPPGAPVLVTLAWRTVPAPCLGRPVDVRLLGSVVGQGVVGGAGAVYEAEVPAEGVGGPGGITVTWAGDPEAVVATLAFTAGQLDPAGGGGPSLWWVLVALALVAMAAAVVVRQRRALRLAGAGPLAPPLPSGAVLDDAPPRAPAADPAAGAAPTLGPAPEAGPTDPAADPGADLAPAPPEVPAAEAPPAPAPDAPTGAPGSPAAAEVPEPWDWRAVALAVAVGCVGIVVLAWVVLTSANRNGSPGGDGSTGPTLVPAEVVEADASSALPDETVGERVFTYGADNTLDGDPATAWSHGDAGPGVGERLIYTFDRPVELAFLEVVNGFDLDQPTYYRNSRVREAAVITDRGTTVVTLEDSPDPQLVEGDFGETTSVVLEVRSVYPGTSFNGEPAFDDVSVSEVRFYEGG